MLQEGLNRKSTILSAGGGWGKSVLLVSFLKSHDFPSVWYSLDHNDIDPTRFIAHISEGIRRRYDGPGKKTLKVIAERGEGANWRSIMSTLFNEILDGITERILLILDDYQFIGRNDMMKEVLSHFLRFSPPNIHILLSSRERPDFEGLERIRAYGELTELGHDELRFNEAETRSFFRAAYNIDLSPRELEMLEEHTEGWIVGLRLIGDAFAGKTPREIGNFLSESGKSRSFIFDYFWKEIVGSLPADIRSFLQETSILNHFNAALCDRVSGKKDSGRIIRELLDRGLFMIGIDEDGEWYRYHHLFRDFLEGCLKKEKSSGFIADLHGKAALYFMKIGEDDEVIYHSIQAWDYDTAAHIMEKRIGYIFSSNLAQRLTCWLEQIPEDAITLNERLLFGKGWANYVNGWWEKAVDHLSLAMEMAIKKSNRALLGKAVYFMLVVHISREEFRNAEGLVKSVMPHLGATSPEMMQSYTLYATALMFLNKPAEAQQVWNSILNSPLAEEDRDAYFTALSGMGYMYHLPLGMFEECLQNIKQGLEYTRENDHTGVRGMFLYFLSEVKHEMGLFDEVPSITKEAVREMNKSGLVFPIPSVLMLSAVNAVSSGDCKQALKAMEEAGEMLAGTDVRNIWRRYHVHVTMAILASHDNDRNGFYLHAGKAVSISRENGDHFSLYQVSCWLAPYYALYGDKEEAVVLLKDSIARMISLGNPYGEARSHLLLASIAYDYGEKSAARRHLCDSLTLSADKGYDFLFLHKEKNHAVKLLPAAIAWESCRPFVSRLIVGLKKECAEPVVALLKDDNPAVRKIAIDILSDMRCREAEKDLVNRLNDRDDGVRMAAERAVEKFKNLPPLPLQVYILGRFRLFIGEREVPQAAWKRKAARPLFKYLLLNTDKWVNVERLIDIFCQEADVVDAAGRLHQATSSLRKVLEPGIPPRKESSYLKFRDGAYRLILPDVSYVDMFDFKRLYERASCAMKEGDTPSAVSFYKVAVDLYRGELFADDLYEEWAEPLKERYTRMYIDALRKLSRYHFDRFEYGLSMNMSCKLLEKEPWDEEAYLMLMKSCLATGDRAGAIRVYKRCREALREELGVEPSRPLADFYSGIVDRKNRRL